MIDLENLAHLARAATPGWELTPTGVAIHHDCVTERLWMRRSADTNYIAAVRPEVVLELVADVRTLHAVVRDARARVIALSLAAELPRGVWSELCRLSSDLPNMEASRG